MKHRHSPGQAGQVLELQKGVIVGALSGSLELLNVQPEGKPKMNALDWARGYQIRIGTKLE
jgi:methionyl-tRNA formyltransferase